MSFVDLLRQASPNASDSSIKVYLSNLKRLYSFYDVGEIPLTGKWLLTDKVFQKYKSFPFNIRRHLSTAAQKGIRSYKIENDIWYTRMLKDQELYKQHRNKNKRSKNEESKMLTGGVKELKKVATEYKRQINRELKETPNLKTLRKYQLYLSLRLFVELPFRNDFPSFHISGDQNNYIIWEKKSQAEFVIQNYKNSDQLGPRRVTISKGLTKTLKQFLKYRETVVKTHDYLLSTIKGEPMSRQAFSKSIHSITKKLTGKSFSSRILRVMHATDNADIIEKSAQLTNKMLHTAKQTKQYIRAN